jgi:hypothetical protein
MPFSNSTLTIQNTLDWLYAYILGRPVTGVGGRTNEPALTAANIIYQTILSPPFVWAWNRNTVAFNTLAGVQDYTNQIQDFGWMEKASLTNAAGTLPELTIVSVVPTEVKTGRPFQISLQGDQTGGDGFITHRLFPVPDGSYTVFIVYQKQAVLITDLTSLWAPIPDRMSFIYSRGMLAMLRGMYDQAAYVTELNLFLRQLVGVSQGLTEAQKNLFLSDALRTAKTTQAELGK